MEKLTSLTALTRFKVSKAHKPPVLGTNAPFINSLSFYENGDYLITGCDDESIRLYDCKTGEREKEIFSKKYGVDLVRFTHHPQTVLYASKNDWDQSIRLLSIHDNKYLRYFKGHRDTVTSLSLSPKDDSFMSASKDGTVRLWDTNSNACHGLIRRIKPNSVVGFDPEGKVFAVGSGAETLKLFDLRNYDAGPFTAWDIQAKGISHWTGLEFSRDGKFILLTADTEYIKLIDAYTGNEVMAVSDYQGSGCVAKFSPDSKYFFFGTKDKKIQVYEVPNNRSNTRSTDAKKAITLTSKSHDAPIRVVDWNPCSAMLASSCRVLSLWIPEEE